MPRELSESHKRALLEGRRRAAAKRAREKRREEKRRRDELTKQLPRLEKAYDKALAEAIVAKEPEDIRRRFDRADSAQNAVINAARQVREA